MRNIPKHGILEKITSVRDRNKPVIYEKDCSVLHNLLLHGESDVITLSAAKWMCPTIVSTL